MTQASKFIEVLNTKCSDAIVISWQGNGLINNCLGE